jgi:hypothetical protein
VLEWCECCTPDMVLQSASPFCTPVCNGVVANMMANTAEWPMDPEDKVEIEQNI